MLLLLLVLMPALHHTQWNTKLIYKSVLLGQHQATLGYKIISNFVITSTQFSFFTEFIILIQEFKKKCFFQVQTSVISLMEIISLSAYPKRNSYTNINPIVYRRLYIWAEVDSLLKIHRQSRWWRVRVCFGR